MCGGGADRPYPHVPTSALQYSLCNEPLIELSNPGASGSVFYVTSDDEFIIKTVMHKEAEFLQKLLPGYYMVCGVAGRWAQEWELGSRSFSWAPAGEVCRNAHLCPPTLPRPLGPQQHLLRHMRARNAVSHRYSPLIEGQWSSA